MTTSRAALIIAASLAALAAKADPPKDVLGFRDLRWGDKAARLGKVEKVQPSSALSGLKKTDEDLSVLGEKAKAISYDFDLKSGGLMGVSALFVETPGLCARLTASITREYGEASERSPAGKAEARVSWERKSGVITLECRGDAAPRGEPFTLSLDFDVK